MAHAWVQAFHGERQAFEAFSRVFPDETTLLVDTYDTLEGVSLAAEIEPPIGAIRLDSGDELDLSIKARKLLDEHDRTQVKIFASGDLDEYKIDEFLRADAPIDAFGIGTELVTSRDAPAISMVYKMVALDGAGRIKLSPGKKTYPLAKQVDRLSDSMGKFLCDHVTRFDETSQGEPLLVPILKNGKLIALLSNLDEIRRHCGEQLARLPDNLRGVAPSGVYPLTYSDILEDEAERLGVMRTEK